jgi:S-adenosyl-L-methionine hydrolase (adenosine-forming)
VSIPDNRPTRDGNTLLGRVTGIDHFGNVITNIHREDLVPFLGNRPMVIRVGREKIHRLLGTYADGATGELMALFGSTDHLEIAVNSGRADRHLNLDAENDFPVIAVDRVQP